MNSCSDVARTEPRVYLFLSLPDYQHQVYKLVTIVPAGEVAYWRQCLASDPFKVLVIDSGNHPNRSRTLPGVSSSHALPD